MDGGIDPFIETYLRWKWKGGVPLSEEDDEEV
jgi:hypothetical protein